MIAVIFPFILAVVSIIVCLWCVKSYRSGDLTPICKVLAGAGIAVTLLSEIYPYLIGDPVSPTLIPLLLIIILPLFVFISYYFHPSWFRPVAIGSFSLILYCFVASILIWSPEIDTPYYTKEALGVFEICRNLLLSPFLWIVIAEFALCIPLVVEHKRRSTQLST